MLKKIKSDRTKKTRILYILDQIPTLMGRKIEITPKKQSWVEIRFFESNPLKPQTILTNTTKIGKFICQNQQWFAQVGSRGDLEYRSLVAGTEWLGSKHWDEISFYEADKIFEQLTEFFQTLKQLMAAIGWYWVADEENFQMRRISKYMWGAQIFEQQPRQGTRSASEE